MPHSKPCWIDSFTLEIVYGWILAAIVATGLVLLSECAPQPAHAGYGYLEGGIGAAFFRPTVTDGTWRQDHVQTPNFRLMDSAWTIGAGYRINERWSIQGHRFDWGSSQVKSRFASDEDYYSGKCPACKTTYYKVMDRMWGYDLTVTRHFQLKDAKLEPYVKGGVAIAFHELKWTEHHSSNFGTARFNGAIPMLVVGGGLCWEHLCWDNLFYTGTMSMNGGCLNGGQYDCGYPLAKQVGTSMLVVKIPLGS